MKLTKTLVPALSLTALALGVVACGASSTTEEGSVQALDAKLDAQFAARTKKPTPTPRPTATPDTSTFPVKDGLYVNYKVNTAVPFIKAAKKTLDIEIYQMTDVAVQQAVILAAKSGVKVRIVHEPQPVGTKCGSFGDNEDGCTQAENFKSAAEAAGVTFVEFNKELCGTGSGGTSDSGSSGYQCVMHGKLMIADKKAAWISTGNLRQTSLCSDIAERCNADYAYVTSISNNVVTLGRIFDKDYNGLTYNINTIFNTTEGRSATVTASPVSTDRILSLVTGASRSLNVENQYLKYLPLQDAIVEASNNIGGDNVHLTVASLCTYGKPSASDARKGRAIYGDTFGGAGIVTRFFTANSLKPTLNSTNMHAKTILVDSARAWVGSVNGSQSAFEWNREFGIFFNNSTDVNTLKSAQNAHFGSTYNESLEESLICAKDRPIND